MAENKDFFNKWLENSADEEDKKIIDLMTFFNEKGCFYSSADVENIYQSLKNKSANGELQDNFDVLNEKLSKLNIKKSLTDKIEIIKTDEFGCELLDASGRNVLVEGEEKEQYFKTVAENIRMKMLFRNLLSSDFSKLQDAPQDDKLKDEFDNESAMELAVMAGAEGVKKPTERDFLSPVAYENTQTSGVFAKVKSFFNSNKKVRISDNMFVASQADHATRFKGMLDVFSNVLSKETTNKIKLKLGNSINFAKKLWQNKYEIASNVAESLASNSLRTVVGVGASLAVTASVGTFWAIPAVAAYGAYSWASGKIWPIVQERQKMMKQEKDGKKLWGSWLFKKELWNDKAKWQEAKKRALEKPGYKARVVTGWLSAGVALVTCGGLSLSWSDAFTNGIKAKVGMSLLNTFGASAAQVTEVAHSVSDYRNNKSEENRKNMNSAIYGAIAGLAAAGVGTYFAINRLEGTQTELQNVVSGKNSSNQNVNNVVDSVRPQNANQSAGTDTTRVSVDTVKTGSDTTLVEEQPKAKAPAPKTVVEEQPKAKTTAPKTIVEEQPKAKAPAPKTVVEEQPKAKAPAPKTVVEEQPKAKAPAPKTVVEEQPKAKATAPKTVVEEQPKAKAPAPKTVVEEQPKAKAPAPKTVVEEQPKAKAPAPKTIVEEQPKAKAPAPKTVVEDKSVAEQKVSEPMVEGKTEPVVEQKVAPKSEATTVSKNAEPEFVLPEMNEKEQALFDVLKGRYAESNPDMADKLAAQTLQSYRQSLEGAEFEKANSTMVDTHNMFEEKEVESARNDAYTVESGDSKRLAKLKGEAKAAYKAAEKAVEDFAKVDKQLQEYLEQHPVTEKTEVAVGATAENTDALDPLNADVELLKLQKQHGDLMKDMVDKQVTSAELDLDLRKLQLQKDLIDAAKEKADLKKDLKLWERLEKQIEKLDAELSKLRLGEFDNEAKENLSETPVENVVPSDKNMTIAHENLQKYEHAQLLDKEKNTLLGQQEKIVDRVVRKEGIEVTKEVPEGEAAEDTEVAEKTGREILTEAIDNKETEIKEMKAEVKAIRKGTQTEVEAFNVDEYEGSEQQKAAGDMAKDYQKETPTTETLESVPENKIADENALKEQPEAEAETNVEAQPAENEDAKVEENEAEKAIEAKFADNPSKEFHDMEKELIDNAVTIDSKDENGVYTVMFTMEDGAKASVTRTPSGKAIVFHGNKITSFAPDGVKQEYTNTGKEFVDTQGKKYNATALIKNLKSQNNGR